MTLKQLRYLCEIVNQGMHLSLAASVLHTSQPGVSRQIQLLERELGVRILQRSRNRILGLTPTGKCILRFAQRTLQDADNLRSCGRERIDESTGDLVIATNHTHARYTLPRVINAFRCRYPAVRLQFLQGSRDEVFKWVDAGEADLAIGTDCDADLENVVLLPFGTFHRIVITPPRHKLLKVEKPTLEDISAYPIITYGSRVLGRWKFSKLFQARNLTPNIVFSAVDSDVSKTYVALGLGIAILPHIVFDPVRDSELRAIDASHLFGPDVVHVGVNKRQFYRRYAFDFMGMLAPDALTRRKVEKSLSTYCS
ncbi:MAG: LysR family transcriptional regulator [Betaproteobacteria bacterium]|nr:LysR family transcriptional regulator [Betaproteobacteria bacterium]